MVENMRITAERVRAKRESEPGGRAASKTSARAARARRSWSYLLTELTDFHPVCFER